MNLLEQINSSATNYNFPMFDNGYVYYGNSRMNVFCGSDNWALVIQVWGFHSRAGEDGLYTALYIYGDKIGDQIGFANDRIIYPLNIAQLNLLNDDESLNINVDKIMVRGAAVDVPKDIAEYNRCGIEIIDKIMFYDFMRILGIKHRDQVLATRAELLSRIGFLPLQERQIDEWIHPDVVNDEIPGNSEIFSNIHCAIQSNDLTLIKSTGDNTHFSNWLESGTL